MQKMKFRGFQLYFNNREAAESMIRQIDDFPSFFTPTEDLPLIIDCGANIGVSVLEWKTRWPQAQILCFEPDPFAFKVLQKNIEVNDVPGVQCVNAAVFDRDGAADFYGQISSTADSRGNSLEEAWANREGSTKTNVKCTRLSTYIADRQVSFLKLDVEGAEQRVLDEIANSLDRVEAIYVEVHQTNQSSETNSAESIERMLTTAGFTVESEPRFGDHALPRHLDSWRQSSGAVLTQLLCWR